MLVFASTINPVPVVCESIETLFEDVYNNHSRVLVYFHNLDYDAQYIIRDGKY